MKYEQTKIKKPCRECGCITRLRLHLGGIDFPICIPCLLALASLVTSVLEDKASD